MPSLSTKQITSQVLRKMKRELPIELIDMILQYVKYYVAFFDHPEVEWNTNSNRSANFNGNRVFKCKKNLTPLNLPSFDELKVGMSFFGFGIIKKPHLHYGYTAGLWGCPEPIAEQLEIQITKINKKSVQWKWVYHEWDRMGKHYSFELDGRDGLDKPFKKKQGKHSCADGLGGNHRGCWNDDHKEFSRLYDNCYENSIIGQLYGASYGVPQEFFGLDNLPYHHDDHNKNAMTTWNGKHGFIIPYKMATWTESADETKENPHNYKISKCDGKCEQRSMLGRSWWKDYGYSSPCECAVKLAKKDYKYLTKNEIMSFKYHEYMKDYMDEKVGLRYYNGDDTLTEMPNFADPSHNHAYRG